MACIAARTIASTSEAGRLVYRGFAHTPDADWPLEVRLDEGKGSATVEGTIGGDQSVDYLLGAAKGQAANISLATRNTATYFNILAPGETEVAFFNGSVNGNQFEGTLPATGDYRIRVYMMRSAARRNETANYRLEMIVSGKPQAATPTRAASAPAN